MILDNETTTERLQSPRNLVNKLNRYIAGTVPVPELARTPEVLEPSRAPEVPFDPLNDAKIVKGREIRSMVNLAPTTRTTIGILANSGETTHKEIAKTFNISPAHVSQIANGGTKGADNTRILAKKEERIQEVQDIALDRLMASLNLIDNDKLANAKVTDLSRIAVDMSRIVEKTTPKDTTNGAPVVNLTLYCPTVKDETHYKVVNVQS